MPNEDKIQYYKQKRLNLSKRLQDKRINTLQSIIITMENYMKDEGATVSDLDEVAKRLKDLQPKIVDSSGEPIKIEKPAEAKKE